MPDSELLDAIEAHSPEGIRKAFADGVSALVPINGRKPPPTYTGSAG